MHRGALLSLLSNELSFIFRTLLGHLDYSAILSFNRFVIMDLYRLSNLTTIAMGRNKNRMISSL